MKHVVRERIVGAVRRAVCTCGDESEPIAKGWSVEQVAAGHCVDGVLLPSPDWGHAK